MTRARALRTLLPAIFFLAWALLFTFPLVARLGDAVVQSRGGDAWLHMWNLWWVDKALVHLNQNPYYTNFLYHPTGLNLYYQSLNLFNALLSIPLQHLFGLTAAFNLLVVANLMMDGLAAYRLCLDRTGSAPASLVGGALFASTPLLGTSLDLGQLDEVTVWWVPLYILALWRALESPGAVWKHGGGRRATLAAGLSLVGASLATWYFTAGLAVFTAIFVPAYLLQRRGGPRAWGHAATKLGAAVAIFLLLLSPLLAAMVGERLGGATYMLSTRAAAVFNSADLAALLLPGRALTEVNRHGSSVAIGYVALALGMVGLAWRWRKLWPVALAFGGLVLMSMGPELQVGGTLTGIKLPYALVDNVPFIGASRQPLRFLATAGACLSLLAAYGVAYLVERLRMPRPAAVVPIAAVVLIAVELFALPRVLASTAISPAYTFIKERGQPGAVLDLPADALSARALLYQTYHEWPIVGGYTSRHFPYPFADAAPGTAQLYHADPDPLVAPDILSPSPADTALRSLDYYGIRYVVVSKEQLDTGRYGRLEEVIAALFSARDKVYEDDSSVVYAAPRQTIQGNGLAANAPLVGLGSGWHKVEPNPLHRWTGSNVTDGNGYIWVGIPPGAAGTYTLRTTVYAYKGPRTLSIVLNGNTLRTEEVGESFKEITVNLGRLGVGNHALLLRAHELPENPPGDQRKLAIGATKIEIVRTGP